MVREICTLIFKLSGWKFKNDIPDELRSFVMIGAPHTSNWDFIPAMAVSYLMKRKAHFVIKSDWLKFPLKFFLVQAGAVGVDRKMLKTSKTLSNTDVMAKFFTDNPEFVLMISPEGTRSPNHHWKSGFYYIAAKARVPIVLGYADYQTKTAGLGKVIYPSNFEEDMRQIMEFYQGIHGKHPENFLLDRDYKPGS